MGLPGILNECSQFLAHFNLQNLQCYSKQQFKNLVSKSIKTWNRLKLVEMVKSRQYQKIDISNWSDDLNLKSYFKTLNVSDARMRFKISSQMVPSIKMNFKSDMQFKVDLWACSDCGKMDSQKHILTCSAYESYRHEKDLSCDKDLVQYFKSVVKHRISG